MIAKVKAEKLNSNGRVIRHLTIRVNRLENKIYISIQDDKTKRFTTYSVDAKDWQDVITVTNY